MSRRHPGRSLGAAFGLLVVFVLPGGVGWAADVAATPLHAPLRIDGRLDEEIYRRVQPTGGFVQQEPQEGRPATEPTEIWVFFDGQRVYVAARCRDSRPERMVLNEMRRDHDGIARNESLAVMLDTFRDGRSGFLFQTNALGALYDAQVTDETLTNTDWNTVWEVRTARDAAGWTVEIAIPFKSLRYRSAGPQTWGINVRRVVRWKNERSTLVPMPVQHGITRAASAASLVGLVCPPGAKHVEFKPYGIAGVAGERPIGSSVQDEFTRDVGGDVKVGVTRGLTFDATFNTDFAQVEADNQQVNLTRFSLFYPEKREFFLEGQGIFDFGGGSQSGPLFHASNTPILFFSRTIGLAGGRAVPIEAGGRLTGRLGRYTVGALAIRTGEEEVSGAIGTGFTVARVKRDLWRRSSVGVIATRRSPGGEAQGVNSVLGVDATLAPMDDLRFVAYAARSMTPGREGRDASYRAQLDYNSDELELKLEHLVVEENFSPGMGFVRRTDFRQNFGYFRYSPRPSDSRVIRKGGGVVSFDYITDNAGRLETQQLFLEAFIDFQNGDTWDAHVTRNLEAPDAPFEIGDGVEIVPGVYRFDEVVTNYRLGPQRVVPSSFGFERGGYYGGTRTAVTYSGRLKFSPKFSVEPGLSMNVIRLPEADLDAVLLTTRATCTPSPRFFVSALLQYNSTVHALSSNVRLRWEYRPGSEFFVVYSEGRATRPAFSRLESRTFVVKLTRLVRF